MAAFEIRRRDVGIFRQFMEMRLTIKSPYIEIKASKFALAEVFAEAYSHS